MSRGTKSKAVSGEKGSPPYEESGSVNMKMMNRFRIVKERFDKQHKSLKTKWNAASKNKIRSWKHSIRRPGTLISVSTPYSFGCRSHVSHTWVFKRQSPVRMIKSLPKQGKEELPHLNRSDSTRSISHQHYRSDRHNNNNRR